MNSNEKKIYQNTLKYIERKIRTEYEINKYLDKYNLPKDTKSKIINNLKAINLINDEIYTKIYINNQIEYSNTSPNKIKTKLIHLGIDKNLIDTNLELIEDDIWLKIINRIIKEKEKNSYCSKYLFKSKIKYNLSILGYKQNLIDIALNIYNYNEDKKLKELINKYWVYYIKTNNPKEIDIIKKKLLLKGYKIENINNCINDYIRKVNEE